VSASKKTYFVSAISVEARRTNVCVYRDVRELFRAGRFDKHVWKSKVYELFVFGRLCWQV